MNWFKTLNKVCSQEFKFESNSPGFSGLGYFELDRDTGLIRTSTVIDYERKTEFWLTIRATDKDERAPLHSYAHVYIKIIDVNDHRPLFSQPIYFPSVVENSEPNKVVLHLNATDGDASLQSSIASSIKYTIEGGNDQSNFVLDENTGYLVTGKKPLDRENKDEHELYIQACDQKRMCSTALVVVTVIVFDVRFQKIIEIHDKPPFRFLIKTTANQGSKKTRSI